MNVFIHTAGNSDWNFRAPDDDPSQPHLLQFSAVTEPAGEEFPEIDMTFAPPSAAIEISLTAALRLGFADGESADDHLRILRPARRESLQEIIDVLQKAERVVAHAAAIHRKMLRAACARLGVAFPDMEWFCTMTYSSDICKLPSPSGRGRSKWPTLDEAYQHFDGDDAQLRESIGWESMNPNLEGLLAVKKTAKVFAGIMAWRQFVASLV